MKTGILLIWLLLSVLPACAETEGWKSCDDASLTQAERIKQSNYVVEILLSA